MHLKTLFTGSLLAVSALAIPTAVENPTRAVEKRATEICGKWDSVQTGNYTLYQDLWGQSSATSGSQCTTFNSLFGSFIAWSTSWSWTGASRIVKSFANVALAQSTGYQISRISSIPSVWVWRYAGTNITTNVAYDLFTTSTATGPIEYEIMIWIGAFGGANPISTTGYPINIPRISGRTWQLYQGLKGSMKVYSFVATSNVPDFSADLKEFFNYMAAILQYPTSQYLLSIGAGTEAYIGSNAAMNVIKYSVAINLATVTTTTPFSTLPIPTTLPSLGAWVPLYGQCGGTDYTGLKNCAVGLTCVYSNSWYSQCISPADVKIRAR